MTEVKRLYETTFIVRPDLDAAALTALRERYRDLLSEHKAPQVRWESWGKRKLAYAIDGYPKGFYLHVLYIGDTGVVAEFERNLRLDENVMRYLSIRVLEKVDPATFNFEEWAAKMNPLALRDEGEFDEVADDTDASAERPKRAVKDDDDDDDDDDAPAVQARR